MSRGPGSSAVAMAPTSRRRSWPGQVAPAPAERRKARPRLRHNARPAPFDALEEPRRKPPQRYEGVAAVGSGREHRVCAAREPARRAPQVRGPERRGVGAHQDDARRATQRVRERVVHARAEVRAPLPARGPQRDLAQARRPRGGERTAHEARVQARGAFGSEARNEARLHAPGARLARENQHPSASIGAPAHRGRRRASIRSAAAT